MTNCTLILNRTHCAATRASRKSSVRSRPKRKKVVPAYACLITICLVHQGCQPIPKVVKPTRENDAPPTITIFPILTSGTTDFTNDGITVSGTTVNVSAGATIQITGRADNFKGGVNAFSISVTKIPVGDTATGTATGVVSKRNLVPVSLGITGPNGGGKAFSYTLVSEKEVLKIDSTATNFNQQTTTLTANIRVTQYTKRISGIHFLDFDSKDSGDHFYENNGFLLAVHDPGCGIKGNDGKDRFFCNRQTPTIVAS